MLFRSDPGGDPTADNPPDPLAPQLPETLGPMQRCPIPGGPAAVPPSGICAGAVVTRRLANIGDEGNAIVETGGEELYSLPLTPPETLGGSDWNGKSISYSFECPDGTEQPADPCENPTPRDGTYDAGGRTLTITATSARQWEYGDCYPNTFVNTAGPISQSITSANVLTISVSNLDFTANINHVCTDPSVTYGVPPLIVSVTTVDAPTPTVALSIAGQNTFVYQDYYIYSEGGRNVTVTFADDPGNPVPLESLPRLS